MGVRTLVAGALAASVVTGVVVTMTTAPAAASSDDIVAPSDDAVVTDGSSVDIRAHLDLLEYAKLRLRGPEDDSFHTVDKGMGDLKYGLDVSCPDYAGSCHGRHPAPNGTYKVQVRHDGLLNHSVEDEQTFALRLSPQHPTGVSVEPKGSGAALVQWNLGDEPDLASYDVLNSSGSRVKQVSAADACDDGECSTVVDVPAGAAGQRITYTVRAQRLSAPGSDDTVPSSPSAEAAVTIPDRPTPSPSASTMSTPGPSGHSQANTTPTRRGTPLPSGMSTPLPTMRSLASASHLALPDVAADSDKTFKRRLNYPPEVPSGGSSAGASASGSQADTSAAPPRSMSAYLRPSEWWKTVALGLVLLLVAAHLGAWSWRARPAPPRIRPGKKGRGSGVGTPAAVLAAEVPDASSDGEAETKHSGRSGYRGRRRAQ